MASGDNMRAVFNALNEVGRCLAIDELATATGLEHRAVSAAAAKLVRDDLVERVARGCFQLTAAAREALASGTEVVFRSGPRGPTPRTRPVAGSLRARLWHAMRIREKFTIGDLLGLAAQDETQAPCNAGRYLSDLARAGYVRVLARRAPGHKPTSNGCLRYSLIRNTGPLAPIVRRKRAEIYDPNTREVTPCRIG